MFLNKVYHNKSKNVNRQVKKYMDYLSIDAVAELKEKSERYIQRLCKDGKLEGVRQELNSKGRPKYLIPVTALSEQEQAKYYRQKRTETGVLPELTESEKPLKYNLKASEKAFEDFSAEEREIIAFWIALLNEWQSERSKRKDKTEFDKIFVAHQKYINPEISISVSILYKKYSAYKSECYEGLIDGRGGWNRGKCKLDENEFMWTLFLQSYLEDSRPKVRRSYNTVVNYITEHCPEYLEEIPSERTFRRKIESIPDAVLDLARKGEGTIKDNYIPRVRRNYSNIEANDIWIMDNYTMDVMVLGDSGKSKRMYLTGVQDAKSGVFVGYNITDSPDSQSTVMALYNAILKHGKPKVLYVDNGSEFCTYDLFGRGIRKSAKDKIDHVPPSVLDILGIEGMIAKPRSPQSKAIERTHRTFSDQFCRSCRGFCGGVIAERPETLNLRIKKGDIETEDELRKLFAQYIDYDYNQQTYGGNESKFKGMSRMEVWNNSVRNADISIEKFEKSTLKLMLMRNTGYQKVKKNGVFIPFHGEKLWYYDEFESWKLVGKEVCVRYNPANPAEVRIYDEDDRYMQTWKCADSMVLEIMHEAPENIREAMRLEASVQKQIKEYLANIRTGNTDNGSFNSDGIHRIDMIIQNTNKGKTTFNIENPKNIVPVIPAENQEFRKAVGCEDKVTFDLSRINKNLRGIEND